MIDYNVEFRFRNSIDEILYSDAYEKNSDLFDKGVDILRVRIENKDWSEFDLDERNILEDIFSLI